MRFGPQGLLGRPGRRAAQVARKRRARRKPSSSGSSEGLPEAGCRQPGRIAVRWVALLFERFTQRARQVVVLAQDEARALKHNYIGTEHILLGLLREEEGLAARVLEALGVRLEKARGEVARRIGEGDEVMAGQIPFTPRAKKVLDLSLRESAAIRHDYIGTEHILLGLARENEGVASEILRDLGADAERIRAEVGRMLGVEVAAVTPARKWRIWGH
jgi:hypothetical protein